jgi:hypothetical protein
MMERDVPANLLSANVVDVLAQRLVCILCR